jgi:hypothetical protein
MRVLTKYHGYLRLQETTPGSAIFDIVGSAAGWNRIQTSQQFVSSTYFDLNGLAIEDETVFLDAATVQVATSPALVGQPGDSMLIYDIMTSIPIEWQSIDLTGWATNGIGFPGSLLNYEHVLYQRLQRWTLDLDAQAAFPMMAMNEQSGSLAPTASDRIYCYRIVQPFSFSAGLTDVGVPPARYVLQLDAKKEQEYQYLMRLKKSYDLQQTPDVD